MNNKPLVSCLMATYGRYSVVCDAVTCFYEQDYENKELIILNNHPVVLRCNAPQVKIYNEPYYPTLGDCRNRLLQLANGEFIRTWDDDDLYLPWAISQGIEMFSKHPNANVCKPKKSWSWHKNIDRMLLQGNRYEASWTMKKDFVLKYGYKPSSGGNEHRTLVEGLQIEGGYIQEEVGPDEASYVYTWGTGLCHISGSLPKEGDNNIEQRTLRWMEKNHDSGNGKPIMLTDLKPYWNRIERAKNEL